MINYDELLAPAAKAMRPSGIRKFFDLAADMPRLHLAGRRRAGLQNAVERPRRGHPQSVSWGRTKYTANSGLKELRDEICALPAAPL